MREEGISVRMLHVRVSSWSSSRGIPCSGFGHVLAHIQGYRAS